MSTSPSEGLWVELTCDGNRRALMNDMATQGREVPSVDRLSEDALYECYKLGGEATKRIIEVSRDHAVGLIAPWTWSTKNWSRPSEHASSVFQVTREFLTDLRDNWIDLPENADVRLVHMGRTERLAQADPAMMRLLTDISEYTRDRLGMVVALLMDYSGPDEEERARKLWFEDGAAKPYHEYLDLPRQGIAFKNLHLRIRTGEQTRIKHTNSVMSGYADMEIRDIFQELHLPNYTPEAYLLDLNEFKTTEKRNGK